MIIDPAFFKKLYYIKDAEQVVGRNRLTLRRWWRKNLFPKPTLINKRLAWQADTINAWINQNVQGVHQNEQENQPSV